MTAGRHIPERNDGPPSERHGLALSRARVDAVFLLLLFSNLLWILKLGAPRKDLSGLPTALITVTFFWQRPPGSPDNAPDLCLGACLRHNDDIIEPPRPFTSRVSINGFDTDSITVTLPDGFAPEDSIAVYLRRVVPQSEENQQAYVNCLSFIPDPLVLTCVVQSSRPQIATQLTLDKQNGWALIAPLSQVVRSGRGFSSWGGPTNRPRSPGPRIVPDTLLPTAAIQRPTKAPQSLIGVSHVWLELPDHQVSIAYVCQPEKESGPWASTPVAGAAQIEFSPDRAWKLSYDGSPLLQRYLLQILKEAHAGDGIWKDGVLILRDSLVIGPNEAGRADVYASSREDDGFTKFVSHLKDSSSAPYRALSWSHGTGDQVELHIVPGTTDALDDHGVLVLTQKQGADGLTLQFFDSVMVSPRLGPDRPIHVSGSPAGNKSPDTTRTLIAMDSKALFFRSPNGPTVVRWALGLEESIDPGSLKSVSSPAWVWSASGAFGLEHENVLTEVPSIVTLAFLEGSGASSSQSFGWEPMYGLGARQLPLLWLREP